MRTRSGPVLRATARWVALGLLVAACVTAGDSTPDSGAVAPTGPRSAGSTTTQGPVTSVAPTTTTTVSPAPSPTSTTTPTVGGWPEPPQPEGVASPATTGVAVVAAGGAPLGATAEAAPFVVAQEGLVFPVEDRRSGWLQIMTGCDTTAWVPAARVSFTPTATNPPAGPGFDLAEAVVVVDPGHGGPNVGAVGPAGLVEKHVNLDIARRAVALLSEPHDIDWATGTIVPGSAYPAVGRGLLTRTAGPDDADYEAGLAFRARLAAMAGADAMVSIHNNAGADGPYQGPGSEAFYSVTNAESRRLAGILVEEMRFSFANFEADWMGDTDAGAKYRVRLDDATTDYYGLLRRSAIPTVIAEGAFISNPTEEALLATEGFRHAYAEAVYRAVVRFLTTDDPGAFYTEPYVRTEDAGSGDARPECVVPAQP